MKLRKMILPVLGISTAFCFIGAINASAGINVNQPFGNGLLENGGINETNFMVLGDRDPSAYNVKMGNCTYKFEAATWRSVLFTHNKPIPKTDLVSGSKIVVQYDIYGLGAMWTQCFYASPFSTVRGDWTANYMTMRINKDCVQGYSAPAGSEVWLPGGTEKVAGNTSAKIGINGGAHPSDFGLHGNSFYNQEKAGNVYCTYWLEYDVDTLSLTIYAGNAGAEVKTEYATVKNAFTLAEAENYFMNFAYDNTYEIDNVKVYRVLNDDVTDYVNCTFDSDKEYMSSGSDAAGDINKLVIVDSKTCGSIVTYDTLITVDKPGTDFRITTLNPIKIDDSMDVTFEMNFAYNLNSITSNNKVGVGLGLEKYDVKLSNPTNGASFIYLTVNDENKVVFGVDNIAEDGTVTAVGETNVVADDASANVELKVLGKKDGSVDIKVGSETYNYENVKTSGCISFTQVGEGEVTYSILSDLVSISGYEFKENEGTTKTASFDSGYINPSKFAVQSNIAPETYYIKQETTAHEVNGIVAEDGKVGFYGTSTNSRLMFKDKYADFVLQFDYISDPIAKRILPGGIETGGVANRYSPFYIIFGAPNEIPELNTTYALGIIEGNPTQYFWGAESAVTPSARLGKGNLKVLSTVQECEKSDEAIPCYQKVDGNITIAKYGEANPSIYSFYNKTSRIRLVCINNKVAMYAAEVGKDGQVGEYIELYSTTVEDSFGNVGFGTDSPAWATIDNVGIMAIDKEDALAYGMNVELTSDKGGFDTVSDFENDVEPKPLAKAVVTVDNENKKATWELVENAKEYEVSVKLNNVEKINKVVTGTEIDLSELTEEGVYKIVVTTVPTDENKYLKSRSVEVSYEIKKAEEPTNNKKKGGCSGSIESLTGILTAVTLIGAVVVLKKKVND